MTKNLSVHPQKSNEKTITIGTCNVLKAGQYLPAKSFSGSQSEVFDYLRRQTLIPLKSLNEKRFDGIDVTIISASPHITQLPRKEQIRRGYLLRTTSPTVWKVKRFIRENPLEDLVFEGTQIKALVFLEDWINKLDPHNLQYLESETITIKVTVYREACHGQSYHHDEVDHD